MREVQHRPDCHCCEQESFIANLVATVVGYSIGWTARRLMPFVPALVALWWALTHPWGWVAFLALVVPVPRRRVIGTRRERLAAVAAARAEYERRNAVYAPL